MAINIRGSGIPTRGSGGGGGEITVNDHTGEAISTGVRTIQWNTLDKYGFTATVDPLDNTKILIGDAPVFEPKITFANTPTVQARISVSDTNEPDTFDDGGWANSVQATTANSMPWFNSTLGRGFGADARLRVVVQHSDTLVADETFVCAANGGEVRNGLTVVIADYAEDGDGSAYKGRINVNVDLMSYLPYAQSGKFTVGFQFTEHKWAEVVTFSQTFFFDRSPTSPEITGVPSVREHDTPAERVIKYISGVGYYTTGSKFTIEVPDINNHNDDTSHPNASLSLDSGDFGIAAYTSSPWVNGANWTNVANEDTAQGFDYGEDKAINVANFRHVGNAFVASNVKDSWGVSSNVNTNVLKVCIDTVTNPSTDLVEYFDEENKRLSHADLISPWNSENYCNDGAAIFYGGRAYQGSDLPRILRSVYGTAGTLGSLSLSLPNEKIDGSGRQNPNYTGHVKNAVFWRKFIPANVTTSYPTMSMNILTNGDLATKIANGDIKIYVWKLGSIDNTSPNLILPTTYNPTNQAASLSGSLWAHANYDFATFDEGVSQTAGGSGMITNLVGNLLSLSFSGYNVVGGVLVRFDIKKGTYLEEVSVNFP